MRGEEVSGFQGRRQLGQGNEMDSFRKPVNNG